MGTPELQLSVDYDALWIFVNREPYAIPMLKVPRTLYNIEEVADLLSGYGFWEQANKLRAAKYYGQH